MDSGQRAALNIKMVQLADGDRSAFNAVFASLFPVVQSFALKYIGNRVDAEDIAQQTLVKLFSQVHNYNKSSDALAWVLTIAMFECKTLRQKYRRKREDQWTDESISAQVADTPSPEQRYIDKDLKEAAMKLLAELKVQDQETILTAIWDHDRPPNMAAATFRKRLQRSLESLRTAWRAEYEAE